MVKAAGGACESGPPCNVQGPRSSRVAFEHDSRNAWKMLAYSTRIMTCSIEVVVCTGKRTLAVGLEVDVELAARSAVDCSPMALSVCACTYVK